jgi:hypothetical protein
MAILPPAMHQALSDFGLLITATCQSQLAVSGRYLMAWATDHGGGEYGKNAEESHDFSLLSGKVALRRGKASSDPPSRHAIRTAS